jgi:hypothetical protein
MGSHNARGISTTRGSDSNLRRNLRTSRGSGEAGVPEFTSSTPMRSAPSCRYSGELMYRIRGQRPVQTYLSSV